MAQASVTRTFVLVVTALLLAIVVWSVVQLVGTDKSTRDGRDQDKEEASGKADVGENRDGQIRNSIGMTLVRIPAGNFRMGSGVDEKERFSDEDQHEVEISRAFYAAVHEVTQQQFRDVMGYNPSYFSAFTKFGQGKPGVRYTFNVPAAGQRLVVGYDTDEFPVENVSYEESVEFCTRLSELPPEKQAGRKYRLPSEAEWEYACRGGAVGPFHSGSTLSSGQANFNGIFPYGSSEKGECLQRTRKVGSYAANGFGLCDMHGNVREWCADWYGADYYASSPRRDPQGPAEGSLRVIRGGGWSSGGQGCRSAARFSGAPGLRDHDLGFRVVLVAAQR
jgi:formylglycine-generating enzyme required for sulfatase activity